jgi:5'/3'-nucleotidase SurE
MKAAPPALALSSINRGANLGVETMFSGCVGAAMTSLLPGLPWIALSHTFSDRKACAGTPRVDGAQLRNGRRCVDAHFV